MKVSWDDYSQYMESHKIHVPNHQAVINPHVITHQQMGFFHLGRHHHGHHGTSEATSRRFHRSALLPRLPLKKDVSTLPGRYKKKVI